MYKLKSNPKNSWSNPNPLSNKNKQTIGWQINYTVYDDDDDDDDDVQTV